MILQKNIHYRIAATPTLFCCVIDNYYNNEIQLILRLPKYVYQTQSWPGALYALRMPQGRHGRKGRQGLVLA